MVILILCGTKSQSSGMDELINLSDNILNASEI